MDAVSLLCQYSFNVLSTFCWEKTSDSRGVRFNNYGMCLLLKKHVGARQPHSESYQHTTFTKFHGDGIQYELEKIKPSS